MNIFNNFKTENEKREYLGEVIFKQIEENDIVKKRNVTKEQIEKITGMIISIPYISEVIKISEKKEFLDDRIEEALKLMENQNDKSK